ncbi:MAG: serine--tRNA ligase [alpha proteobacterium HIMB59]|nr:MAG: serine--tRNA ligase [alpha proteobacterium HIMB59]
MHDLNFIRENANLFDELLKKRFLEPQSKNILELDSKKRNLLTQSQEMRSERKNLSSSFSKLDENEKSKLQQKVQKIKSDIDTLEKELSIIETQLKGILSSIPNLPHQDVPVGEDEEANQIIKTVGEIPKFDFTPKLHFELGENLDMLDFEQAGKVSGTRFVYLKNHLAKLERAIANFMLDKHTTEFGYTEIIPPNMVRDAAAYGTGQLPKFSEDLFKTNTDHWLIPTAEVPLTNLVLETILQEDQLPQRLTAWTPCYRSEAGAAGRDTRGMIRQHQFSKVELVSITKEEDSEEELERMLNCATSILDDLHISYQVVLLSSGDMGFSAEKTYDIEVWLPGEGKYREISSCSNCRSFQARRMNARYKSNDQNKFVHTLNGSGLAVGRTLIAVLENYQNSDGSISIPEALMPYMGNLTKISKV